MIAPLRRTAQSIQGMLLRAFVSAWLPLVAVVVAGAWAAACSSFDRRAALLPIALPDLARVDPAVQAQARERYEALTRKIAGRDTPAGGVGVGVRTVRNGASRGRLCRGRGAMLCERAVAVTRRHQMAVLSRAPLQDAKATRPGQRRRSSAYSRFGRTTSRRSSGSDDWPSTRASHTRPRRSSPKRARSCRGRWRCTPVWDVSRWPRATTRRPWHGSKRR